MLQELVPTKKERQAQSIDFSKPSERLYTISRPTPTELSQLWEQLQSERHQLYRFPASLSDLVGQWGHSMLLFTGRVDEHLAALFALCEPAFSSGGSPVAAWVFAYVLPAFRGTHGMHLCQTAVDFFARQGFERFWTGVRADNKPAQRLARSCGFRRCGQVPGLGAPETPGVDAIFYVWEQQGG